MSNRKAKPQKKQKTKNIQETAIVKEKTRKPYKYTKKTGRPTKMTEYTVRKLQNIIKMGVPVQRALKYARITQDSYYKWIKNNPEFAEKMQSAEQYSRIVAGSLVMKAIIKGQDVNTARWLLEKKFPEEFGGNSANNTAKVSITGDKVLVIPGELMEKYQIEGKNDL